MLNNKILIGVLVVAVTISSGPFSFGGEAPATGSADVQKMMNDLIKQMDQLKQTIESQNKKIQYLEQKTSDSVKISQPISGAQATPMSQKEFQDMLGTEIKNYSYLKNLKMGGDLRLRWEAFNEQKGSDALEDRNRFRYRLRYGIENGIGDDMTVGFRLATGELRSKESSSNPSSTTGNLVYGSDPTSTNQTMGSPGLFSFNTIVIEKAYAKYAPKFLKDLAVAGPVTIKKMEIGGGKFDNPFAKYTSPMVWDGDVTPEGLYEKVDLNVYQNEGNEVNLFGMAMQSPLKESGSGSSDAALFAYGTGLNLTAYTPLMEKPVEVTSAVNMYNWVNYSQKSNWVLEGATSLAKGNTTCVGTAGAGPCAGLEGGDPMIMQFYNELKLSPLMNTPITLFNDVASNLHNGSTSGASARESTAWGLGAKLGGVKNRGDWELGYAYYQIPPNAVVGAFSDSDFGQGHSNNVGSVVKAGYGLTKNLTLNLAWFNVRPYDQQLAINNTVRGDHTTNRFQTDLTWKF